MDKDKNIFDSLKINDHKKAFENAIKKGMKNPDDWMYMYSGKYTDYFKHHCTRQYTSYFNMNYFLNDVKVKAINLITKLSMDKNKLDYNTCDDCGLIYNLEKNYEGGFCDKEGMSHEHYKCPNCKKIFDFQTFLGPTYCTTFDSETINKSEEKLPVEDKETTSIELTRTWEAKNIKEKSMQKLL